MKEINYCIDCNKEIDSRSIHCHKCEGKTRRGKQKYYCKECNNEISYNSYKYGQGRCRSCANLGSKNPSFIDGRTPLRKSIRNLEEYIDWTWKIFRKDNFICQNCNYQKARNKLEAHHKKPFAELLEDFLYEYDQFSPIEDKETLVRLAIKWKPFWDIDNGETQCKGCHRLIEPRNIKKKGNLI